MCTLLYLLVHQALFIEDAFGKPLAETFKEQDYIVHISLQTSPQVTVMWQHNCPKALESTKDDIV